MSGREKKIDIGSVLTFNTVFSYLKVLPLLFIFSFSLSERKNDIGSILILTVCFFHFPE